MPQLVRSMGKEQCKILANLLSNVEGSFHWNSATGFWDVFLWCSKCGCQGLSLQLSPFHKNPKNNVTRYDKIWQDAGQSGRDRNPDGSHFLGTDCHRLSVWRVKLSRFQLFACWFACYSLRRYTNARYAWIWHGVWYHFVMYSFYFVRVCHVTFRSRMWMAFMEVLFKSWKTSLLYYDFWSRSDQSFSLSWERLWASSSLRCWLMRWASFYH